VKRVGIVLPGMAQDFQLDLVEQIVIEADPLQIDGDIQLHAGIGEALRDTLTIASVGDLLSDVWKVVLLIGQLDMRQQSGADASSAAGGGADPVSIASLPDQLGW
jgi:hypothetical protein